MSDALTQQERLQAIAEKRKKQAEIENKRRQLEDERRQLQHLKSKSLRERWLLDGAPSSGENEFQKQLQEDEIKTRILEHTVLRLEQEIEELESGVPASKEHSTDTQNTPDGPGKLENGVHKNNAENKNSTRRQLTGIEAKLECPNLDSKAIENASADHPVTMVFMGYKNVENEDETKKVLGIEDEVKAEFVVIADGESKGVTDDGQNGETAPSNGATSTPEEKNRDEAGNVGEAKKDEVKKEKQPCKCCTIM